MPYFGKHNSFWSRQPKGGLGQHPAERGETMKILHISDTHAQGDTMRQLEGLARSLSHFDVVACTGDCVSNYTSEVPEAWNRWPQQFKLIVPGNHLGGDTPETFVHLTNWATDVPWYRHRGDISFIGLHYAWAFSQQLENIAPQFERDSRAVVVLAHKWAEETKATSLAEKLKKFFPGRPVLYLHGHDHTSSWGRLRRVERG